MSLISFLRKWSICTKSQFLYKSISVRMFSLHNSAWGIGEYFIFWFTSFEVSFSFEEWQDFAIFDKFFPQTVPLLSLTKFTSKKIAGLLDFNIDWTYLTNLEKIITLGWMHSEIVSIKYLWVVLGTENVSLTHIL